MSLSYVCSLSYTKFPRATVYPTMYSRGGVPSCVVTGDYSFLLPTAYIVMTWYTNDIGVPASSVTGDRTSGAVTWRLIFAGNAIRTCAAGDDIVMTMIIGDVVTAVL